jgi:hypothetical protein
VLSSFVPAKKQKQMAILEAEELIFYSYSFENRNPSILRKAKIQKIELKCLSLSLIQN